MKYIVASLFVLTSLLTGIAQKKSDNKNVEIYKKKLNDNLKYSTSK